MDEARKWPLDFEKLQKGDAIGKEELERILHAVHGSNVWIFGGLALQRAIKQARPEFAVRFFQKTGLMVILDEEEGEAYTKRWAKNFCRRMLKYMKTHALTDVEKLPPAKQQRFQLDRLRNSRIAQSLLHARAQRPRLNPGKE